MLKDIDLFIINALSEDIGIGDITSLATINKEQTGEAVFYVKAVSYTHLTLPTIYSV